MRSVGYGVVNKLSYIYTIFSVRKLLKFSESRKNYILEWEIKETKSFANRKYSLFTGKIKIQIFNIKKISEFIGD